MIGLPAEMLEQLSDPLLCFDEAGGLLKASPAGRQLWQSSRARLQSFILQFIESGSARSFNHDSIRISRGSSPSGPCIWMLVGSELLEQPAYPALAESCPLSFIRYDRQLRIRYVNQQLVDYLQVGGVEQILGKHPRELWPDGRFSEIERAAERAIEEGLTTTVEWSEPQKQAPPRHHQVMVVPERDSSGTITGALGFGGELTALRFAEKVARDNERSLRAIVEHLPLCICRYDEDCRILFVNPQFTMVWNLSPTELLGKHLESFPLGEPACKERSRREVLRVFQTGEMGCDHTMWNTPNGIRTFEILLIPEKDDHGRVISVLGVAQDITGRLKAEEELRLLTQAVDCSLDSLYLVSEAGVFEYANETALRTLGYERSELLGREFTLVDPDFSMAKFIELVQSDETVAFETTHRRRSGETFPVELSTSPLVFQGKRYRLGIARNVKERKQLEEQLRQACKMDAVGQLAGGIAHDFNNILTAVNLQVEVVKLEEGLSEPVRDGLNVFVSLASSAQQLVQQLLTFSRKQVTLPGSLDFNEVVEGTSTMLRRLVQENIKFSISLAARPLPLMADCSMLEQVLVNLTVNARDAMPDGGKLSIQTRAVTLNQEIAELAPGEYALLVVQDSGIGMDEEVLTHIFEPFFSTKEVGRGTGLGLSSVFGIVKQHSGAIRVQSKPGHGSLFEIYFPLIDCHQSKKSETLVAFEMPRLEGAVLVVEDDSHVRGNLCLLLTQAGLQVVGAEDASQAMDIWKAGQTTFQVLLTDLVLPGIMGGRQLARELISWSPDLKVIFLSGYNQDLAGQRVNQLDGWPFLPKPFVPSELVGLLQQMIQPAWRRID